MAVHAVTFRLLHDATYGDRYESLVRAIRQATCTTFWDEPTSFALIESNESSAQIAARIDRNSTFAHSKDLLLVVNLSQSGFTVLGEPKDQDLQRLMARR